MRRKIQRSMILVIAATLLVSMALLTFVVYRQNVGLMEEEARQEAGYICAAIEASGSAYLEEMDAQQEETRVTWIGSDGDVLYDSSEGQEDMENHADRPEVREAFQSGAGQDIRESDTLGRQMFYYAQRLSDGSVLRVSKTISSALGSALQILPGMAVIAVLMVGLAWMLSKWQVSKLIEPINKLDLEHPLENDVYEELTPLLESMDKQNKEKEAIANMRKEFSANVSHELKTPLTSISGYAEIMMNGLVRPEDVRGFSERIYNEASRLIVLIEDIIRLSKLDEGGGEVEKEEVDLYALTREVCSRLAHKAEKHSVHVEVSGEPVSIVGIRQVLNEMIYNICENAIKYNKPGGKVDVWVGSTLKGVKVIVTDTGIGIPEDQQERIFERFYRVDKSHSKETGGTGLGLSIVKHGAILHNASIHVDSSLGKGTRMELTF
ncbi:two-component sensor histidine kinase [Faecalicatena contorta]|uniref:histidine kinase n=1 Tax=Faecalicatena fissicatena TaxID=290055 RepID=A0ABS2E5J3_9FIRM|nr:MULTISPECIES: ATP-binding protein [Clostridia]MBM6686754.1 two-component sensor histidine kinase [Faecalicatena contorta]MBM6712011.1 two-component sensor histidine kinase [Faecalicatena contorta]MBM6736874.1 two-component sensor histidine kinase [Faecalicatena fissicatena]HIX99347.1 two-component sensor histidine kinase [Candidatus Dorea intestinigallinarum]